MFVVILKFVLVAALLACGAFFLATDLGVEVPLIKYEGLEAHNVPVGIAFLVAGVALARFWRVSITKIEEQTTTTKSDDVDKGDQSSQTNIGSTNTTKSKKSTITTIFKPPSFKPPM